MVFMQSAVVIGRAFEHPRRHRVAFPDQPLAHLEVATHAGDPHGGLTKLDRLRDVRTVGVKPFAHIKLARSTGILSVGL